jgi:DNA-binding Lrp family transcriptional regulator
MGKELKLDTKDFRILRELDKNYRTPFSKIAKKVGLSKNSVSLRYERLKELISHSTVGINNELLGYKVVKVYYAFNTYNNSTEQKMKKVLKKHKNILWAAKFYGPFDVSICLIVKDINELINHVTDFNDQFSKQIKFKAIQIIHKQFFFRHSYLYKKPIRKYSVIKKTDTVLNLSENDKKILSIMRNDPRISLIDIAKITNLSTKTIAERIKALEKNKIITGFFATFDNSKLGFETSRILIKIQKPEISEQFENHLCTIPNIRHFRKILGSWDYEIDIVNKNADELHQQIENLKQAFPNLFKEISLASFGKRIITNKERFLD